FKYGFDVPSDATTLTFPNNEKVRVLAVTAAKNAHDSVVVAHPLFDTLEDHSAEAVASIEPNGGEFHDVTRVTLHHALYWNAGGLHYTLDGSEPTAQSLAYTKPIALNSSAQIRVRQFDSGGRAG